MAWLSGRFAKETNHVNDAWRIRAVGQGYGTICSNSSSAMV